MANADSPNGFKRMTTSTGYASNSNQRKFYKDASVILAVGDLVVAAGSAESGTGIPTITRITAASSTITGLITQIGPNYSDLSKRHLAAADTGYVYVDTDPNIVMEAQEDSVGGNIVAGDMFHGIDVTVTDAIEALSLSQMELDSSTADAGTDGTQLRLVGGLQRADNTLFSANARYLTTIAKHSDKDADAVTLI